LKLVALSRAQRLVIALLLAGFGGTAVGDETQALETRVKQYEIEKVSPLRLASTLEKLAESYESNLRYSEAEKTLLKALALREEYFEESSPLMATSLNNLASLYYSQGRYVEAEPLFERALAIRERALGSKHPAVASSLSNLAALNMQIARYTKAEELFERAQAIEKHSEGEESAAVATTLNNLGELYREQGKYALAESFLKNALALREKIVGPQHPDTALTLKNLAALYLGQGLYKQAEPLYRRSLAIRESTLGLNHPEVASSLHGLGTLYHQDEQFDLAEACYERALAINEQAFGAEHPAVALSLNNLAHLYLQQDRYSVAEPLFQRVLAIREKQLGQNHTDVAHSLLSLAKLYEAARNYTRAENLFERSLHIFETNYGANHFLVTRTLNNLGSLYAAQGLNTKASETLERALEINEHILHPEHPEIIMNLDNLAAIYVRQKRFGLALSVYRRVGSIYLQRLIEGGVENVAIRGPFNSLLKSYIPLLYLNPNNEPIDKIIEESFRVTQLYQESGTSTAIAKMAARFASGETPLASLIKRKQDADDRRSKTESLLIAESVKNSQLRSADHEKRLRNTIGSTSSELEIINIELDKRFPEYREMVRLEPISVHQIRALLKQDEALLVYSHVGKGYLWVVTSDPDRSDIFRLGVDIGDIAAKVAAVRAEMEPDRFGVIPRVSIKTLHSLFQSLVAPAMPLLKGIKHVMVVPSGPLQSLSFGMLVATPRAEIGDGADYRQVDWLGKHFAFSVLPSARSIMALRQFAKPVRSPEPFAGFGDPLIGNEISIFRGVRTKIDVASVFPNRTAKANFSKDLLTPEIADVEAIRLTPRLPETANELLSIGEALKANKDSIWLQEHATETRIKELDLSNYRTIAFATHGMLAGEIAGVGEPGLILTPPKLGTIEDDGYLSASEIARLKLNADWVILSACNTAAADGTPGAEGLSGLAKAFFYAGARSLLVSNWYVDSEAAVRITTATLKRYSDNPAIGKAEALRQAMQELRDEPEFSHPFFWAPFSIVGEGGVGPMQ
jgi:CHAT domain-containing protein/tetratricopeptide (TPR) repeat protein